MVRKGFISNHTKEVGDRGPRGQFPRSGDKTDRVKPLLKDTQMGGRLAKKENFADKKRACRAPLGKVPNAPAANLVPVEELDREGKGTGVGRKKLDAITRKGNPLLAKARGKGN